MSAQSAAPPHLSATASPATGCGCRHTSAGGYGSAPRTGPKPSDVERRLCEWQRLLLIRRLHRAQLAHRATSSIRKALAAATLACLQ